MANRIRELRHLKGWTQGQLAERVRSTTATINKLETETMQLTLPWLERIAQALGVKVSELLPDDLVESRPSAVERQLLNFLRNLGPRDQFALMTMAKSLAEAPADDQAA